jgi:hypothetical protein
MVNLKSFGMKIYLNYFFVFLFTTSLCEGILAQRTIYEPLDMSKVEFSFEDFGSMWTFDAVPLEKYKKLYNFTPDQTWLEHVQKAALQFTNGCSAAFVSEDGLIFTNHHCFRGVLAKVQQKGENLFRDGFYAKTLADERIFPDMFVDQLIEIKDVTGIITEAMDKGNSDMEKVELKERKIKELTERYASETGLVCRVVTLYHGGKYSLYMYKRYTDIRLVMAPDVQITATGWDWDNFTYPRYELDFAFLRAYENGKPVKTKYFYKWSKNGAAENEPVFVIGRPGNTDRLLSVRELEFYRDIRTPMILQRFNELYQAYFKFFQAHPDRHDEILSQLLSVANGRKSFAGGLVALNDNYLMAKKKDFEKKLRARVQEDPVLQIEYGTLWEDINAVFDELGTFEKEIFLLNFSEFYSSSYHQTARNLVNYAMQTKLPENERAPVYKTEKLEQTRKNIFVEPKDADLQEWLVISHADFVYKVCGEGNEILKKLYGSNTGKKAFEFFAKNTQISDKKFVEGLIEKGPEAIEKTEDPLIRHYFATRQLIVDKSELRNQLYSKIEVLNQKLGKLIFEAYGLRIPPDATSTLRISDGLIRPYEYNGTIAPGKVTFYGLYDRYFSFGKKDYPWGLHPKWQKPAPGLDLSIPIGFASTNDIVGGNSGSSVINRNGEVVGIVHDGNLESLAGAYAFLEENNRAVATDSWGLMEALKFVYKTNRLVSELQNSRIK